MKNDVREIKEQNRRRRYVDGNGNVIEVYKNLTRKIKNDMNPIYRHSFADVFLKTGIINANTGALITSGDAVQNRYYSTYVSVSNVYPRVLLINTGVDRGAFYDSNKNL